MSRIHISTRSASDWRSRLGDPAKHWKRGASAMETAVNWELAARTEGGLPEPIFHAFEKSRLGTARLLLAVAEHKVPLEGKGGDAQCDLWALVESKSGIVSMSIEAKVNEPFGNNNESLAEWLKGGHSSHSGSNRNKRWAHLKAHLPKREEGCYDAVPYQILQRCAAAVIEARRFRLQHAVFLVQSFDPTADSLKLKKKYELFVKALGLPTSDNQLGFSQAANVQLGIGWVDCAVATDSQIEATLDS